MPRPLAGRPRSTQKITVFPVGGKGGGGGGFYFHTRPNSEERVEEGRGLALKFSSK